MLYRSVVFKLRLLVRRRPAMVGTRSSVLNILLKTVGLCVAGIDTLRESREVLTAKFFKKCVCVCKATSHLPGEANWRTLNVCKQFVCPGPCWGSLQHSSDLPAGGEGSCFLSPRTQHMLWSDSQTNKEAKNNLLGGGKYTNIVLNRNY